MLLHLIDSIMFHSPPIEGLRRSEVIINHFAFSVHQSSELGQLGAGDLQRSLEVDPFNHLKEEEIASCLSLLEALDRYSYDKTDVERNTMAQE